DPFNTRAVFDLSSIFQPALSKAQRGIAIINKSYVTVRDEIETGDKGCTIRWAMLTPAKVEKMQGNRLILSSGSRQLQVWVEGIENMELKTWSAEPPQSYDAPNPGTVLVGFELQLPANS